MQIRRWNEQKPNMDLAAELAAACEINPFLSLMLTARGIDTPDAVFAFLVGQEEEIDPYSYIDMEAAVERVRCAIDEHQRVLVYGDYDTDGITATVLLYTYLKRAGVDVLYRIPLRDEGYGLHSEAIDWAKENGVQLIITVDTGVTAVEEVAQATALGMDVVVTDHHQPSLELPAAVAVVDPHRVDCDSTFKDLAGVGVAFMLVCALSGDGEKVFADYGDLLALGTLADMMPLQGLNRDLMRRCLSILDASRRPGLVALRRMCGMEDKPICSSSVSYRLAPRLNAAGRLADPVIAAQLLLADTLDDAMKAAETLQTINAQRQEATTNITAQVDVQLEQHPEWLYDRILVVHGEKWLSGLLGVVAARLMDRYGKPVVVLSVGEDGIAHGSCRSVDGFSILEVLAACSDYSLKFGGHDLACGVSVSVDKIDEFRAAINAYAAQKCSQMPERQWDLTVCLRPDQINVEMPALVQVLAPFGMGNPEPLFGLYRMRLDNISPIGGGKHLRLSLSRNGVRINALKFQTMPEEFPIPCGATVNCVVSLESDEGRGSNGVSVYVKDICYADTDRDQLMQDLRTFEAVLRGEAHPTPESALATREQLARLYNMLIACKEWNGTPEQLQHALGNGAPTCLQLLIALEIWRQAGLVYWYDRGEKITLRIRPVEGKADLTATPLWKYIMKGDAENG